MNVFIITESNLKNLFKKLIGREQEENLNFNRNSPLNHKNYQGWNFTYLEKNENEDIEDLFNFSFDKIEDEKKKKDCNKDASFIFNK